MGFEGFIISDWNAIHQLPGDLDDQVVASINAGVDMLMQPYDWDQVIDIIFNATLDNRISRDRIDDAVRRILQVKYERGLFEDPLARLDNSYLYSQTNQDIAREAVRKSLVLLENNNSSLPLAKDDSVYITGPGADHIGYMSGGWTTFWQGNPDNLFAVGTSILDAFADVLTANGGNVASSWQNADTVVVVLTEMPYSEGVGDNQTLTLTTGNAHPDNAAALEVARQAQEAGKNVVGILLSGRPLLLENYLVRFDSFIAAWLPGTEGGLGISDVVFGDYDFTGTLSYTWPLNNTQFGYTSMNPNYDPNSVKYPYGYGLNYNE
jgi:beta-glucosidase